MMPRSLFGYGLPAQPRTTAMLLASLALVLSVPADAQFAGVYTGSFTAPGDVGDFSVLVRDDRSARGLFFDQEDASGHEIWFFINPDGSFTLNLQGSVATGLISDNSFAGTYAFGQGTLSGDKSPDCGFFAAHGGLYEGTVFGSGTLTGGVSVSLLGVVSAIANAVGQTMFYAGADLYVNNNLEDFVEFGGPVEISETGLINDTLMLGLLGQIDLDSHTGAGDFTLQIEGQDISGTWELVRRETLPGGCGDRDGDGVPDDQDAFPDDPNEWLDTDEDGIGNNADPDDDNDGVLDIDDEYPLGRFSDVPPRTLVIYIHRGTRPRRNNRWV